MIDIRSEVARLLPLRVAGTALNDPFINLFGDGWSLSVDCNWKLEQQDAELTTTWESSSESIAAAVDSLVGRSIVSVEIDDAVYDPIFTFDGGVVLVIEAETDLDPWVFHADGLPVVLVGLGPGGYAELGEGHKR